MSCRTMKMETAFSYEILVLICQASPNRFSNQCCVYILLLQNLNSDIQLFRDFFFFRIAVTLESVRGGFQARLLPSSCLSVRPHAITRLPLDGIL